MFKFIFRAIGTFILILILVVVLAVWKGGEPFRTLGVGTVIMGNKIQSFADFIDDMRKGGSEMHRTYDKFKDVLETDEDDGKK